MRPLLYLGSISDVTKTRGGREDAGDAGMRFSSFFEKKLGKKLSENYIYWRLAELRGQTWD